MDDLRVKSVQNSALWAAYGDALGFISELTDEKGLKRRINSSRLTEAVPWRRRIGGRFGAQMELPAGCYSDDTQLRLATCRAIRGDGVFDVEAFAKIELPVWNSYALGGGVGTHSAATFLARPDVTWFSNFFKTQRQTYFRGGGNGAAMRIQPHIWAAKEKSAPDTFTTDVVRNAICTHGHPRGVLGAVFHAYCLARTFELQGVPGPDVWTDAVEYFGRVVDLVKNDSELKSFWLPVWEQGLGGSIDRLIEQVQMECRQDLVIVEEFASKKSEIAYVQMVKSLGCMEGSSRGSGTKTAIIASALAWMQRTETPANALEIAANLLFSDTDTIASMAGAILGVIAPDPPINRLLDRNYIAREAERLYAISTGESQFSFSYPDLLQWEAPRNHLDAVGLTNNQIVIAGLGIARPKSNEVKGLSKDDVVWQWLELDFGQSMPFKRRLVLSPLRTANIPKKLRHPEQLLEDTTQEQMIIPTTTKELTLDTPEAEPRRPLKEARSIRAPAESKPRLPQIGADDFARRFSLRAANFMWLLGAGASASAGIPTAWDMIWDFKQQLFISQRRVSPQAVADLSSPVIRRQLQAHIDSLGTLPRLGDPDEYAALFEAVYPAEVDRQSYLSAKMGGGKPSYGHLALAAMMYAQLTRIVWTTNFDPLVADACAKVYRSTGPLTTVALDAPEMAAHSIADRHWPIEIKLHGDFRSRRLKNTSDELRHQERRLRQILVDCCCRFGLVVVGYSGRDASIMETLEEVLEHNGAFPSGIFWLHRGEDSPLARVQQLLVRAKKAGVDAALVKVENFDEVMRDLVRLTNGIDTKILDEFASDRPRWSPAPYPEGSRGWPVIRLNALPVVQMPTVCRRVECKIGGYAEVRDAVEKACVDVLVARTQAGILAYGSDESVRRAFGRHDIRTFDLHTIETKRLSYESGERGLLRDALTRAIQRKYNLEAIRRQNTDLLAPRDPQSGDWELLRRLLGTLDGTVSGYPELRWREGIGTRLAWADNRLWLLVEPRIVFDGITNENRAVAASFARERTVKRYNRQVNDVIEYWAVRLAGNGCELRALGTGEGVDAVFRLSSDTGFSRRVGV